MSYRRYLGIFGNLVISFQFKGTQAEPWELKIINLKQHDFKKNLFTGEQEFFKNLPSCRKEQFTDRISKSGKSISLQKAPF